MVGVSWDDPLTWIDQSQGRDTTSERDLFRGYRGTRRIAEAPPGRVEPCACGGQISVAIEADSLILRAVQTHQRTVRHNAWRQLKEASRQ